MICNELNFPVPSEILDQLILSKQGSVTCQELSNFFTGGNSVGFKVWKPEAMDIFNPVKRNVTKSIKDYFKSPSSCDDAKPVSSKKFKKQANLTVKLPETPSRITSNETCSQNTRPVECNSESAQRSSGYSTDSSDDGDLIASSQKSPASNLSYHISKYNNLTKKISVKSDEYSSDVEKIRSGVPKDSSFTQNTPCTSQFSDGSDKKGLREGLTLRDHDETLTESKLNPLRVKKKSPVSLSTKQAKVLATSNVSNRVESSALESHSDKRLSGGNKSSDTGRGLDQSFFSAESYSSDECPFRINTSLDVSRKSPKQSSSSRSTATVGKKTDSDKESFRTVSGKQNGSLTRQSDTSNHQITDSESESDKSDAGSKPTSGKPLPPSSLNKKYSVSSSPRSVEELIKSKTISPGIPNPTKSDDIDSSDSSPSPKKETSPLKRKNLIPSPPKELLKTSPEEAKRKSRTFVNEKQQSDSDSDSVPAVTNIKPSLSDSMKKSILHKTESSSDSESNTEVPKKHFLGKSSSQTGGNMKQVYDSELATVKNLSSRPPIKRPLIISKAECSTDSESNSEPEKEELQKQFGSKRSDPKLEISASKDPRNTCFLRKYEFKGKHTEVTGGIKNQDGDSSDGVTLPEKNTRFSPKVRESKSSPEKSREKNLASNYSSDSDSSGSSRPTLEKQFSLQGSLKQTVVSNHSVSASSSDSESDSEGSVKKVFKENSVELKKVSRQCDHSKEPLSSSRKLQLTTKRAQASGAVRNQDDSSSDEEVLQPRKNSFSPSKAVDKIPSPRKNRGGNIAPVDSDSDSSVSTRLPVEKAFEDNSLNTNLRRHGSQDSKQPSSSRKLQSSGTGDIRNQDTDSDEEVVHAQKNTPVSHNVEEKKPSMGISAASSSDSDNCRSYKPTGAHKSSSIQGSLMPTPVHKTSVQTSSSDSESNSEAEVKRVTGESINLKKQKRASLDSKEPLNFNKISHMKTKHSRNGVKNQDSDSSDEVSQPRLNPFSPEGREERSPPKRSGENRASVSSASDSSDSARPSVRDTIHAQGSLKRTSLQNTNVQVSSSDSESNSETPSKVTVDPKLQRPSKGPVSSKHHLFKKHTQGSDDIKNKDSDSSGEEAIRSEKNSLSLPKVGEKMASFERNSARNVAAGSVSDSSCTSDSDEVGKPQKKASVSPKIKKEKTSPVVGTTSSDFTKRKSSSPGKEGFPAADGRHPSDSDDSSDDNKPVSKNRIPKHEIDEMNINSRNKKLALHKRALDFSLNDESVFIPNAVSSFYTKNTPQQERLARDPNPQRTPKLRTDASRSEDPSQDSSALNRRPAQPTHEMSPENENSFEPEFPPWLLEIKQKYAELHARRDNTFSLEDLSSEDEVWTMQLPKNVDPESLLHSKLQLDGEGVMRAVNSSGKMNNLETVAIRNDLSVCNLILPPSSSSNRLQLGKVKLVGSVIVTEGVGETVLDAPVNVKVNLSDSDSDAGPLNTTPLPQGLRVRHPIYGTDYSNKPSSAKQPAKRKKKRKLEQDAGLELKVEEMVQMAKKKIKYAPEEIIHHKEKVKTIKKKKKDKDKSRDAGMELLVDKMVEMAKKNINSVPEETIHYEPEVKTKKRKKKDKEAGIELLVDKMVEMARKNKNCAMKENILDDPGVIIKKKKKKDKDKDRDGGLELRVDEMVQMASKKIKYEPEEIFHPKEGVKTKKKKKKDKDLDAGLELKVNELVQMAKKTIKYGPEEVIHHKEEFEIKKEKKKDKDKDREVIHQKEEFEIKKEKKKDKDKDRGAGLTVWMDEMVQRAKKSINSEPEENIHVPEVLTKKKKKKKDKDKDRGDLTHEPPPIETGKKKRKHSEDGGLELRVDEMVQMASKKIKHEPEEIIPTEEVKIKKKKKKDKDKDRELPSAELEDIVVKKQNIKSESEGIPLERVKKKKKHKRGDLENAE